MPPSGSPSAWDMFWGTMDCSSLTSFSLWGSTSAVTPTKVREALMSIDPSLDKQTLDSYLSQAFQISITELAESDQKEEKEISLETALEHLRVIDFIRTVPREQESAMKVTVGNSLTANL